MMDPIFWDSVARIVEAAALPAAALILAAGGYATVRIWSPQQRSPDRDTGALAQRLGDLEASSAGRPA